MENLKEQIEQVIIQQKKSEEREQIQELETERKDQQILTKEQIEKQARFRGNYENVATLSSGACLLNKCDVRKGGHLLRDDYHLYFCQDQSTGQGFTACNLYEEIVIQLSRVYEINTIKFFLCDYDSRKYSLELDISEDHKEWYTVHRAILNAQRWNTVIFPPMKTKYIRFYNSGGNSGNKSGQLAIVKVFAYFDETII